MEKALLESEERNRTLFNQLSSIVLGTAPATSGELFFQSLVYHLASALKVDYAFISEKTNKGETIYKTLAFCIKGNIVENLEYDAKGGPCELVNEGQTVVFPEKVQERFPDDPYLKEWKVEAYMGFPLLNARGEAIGLFGVMDDKPIEDVKTVESILSIFASRGEAELQRMRTDGKLSKNVIALERANKELQDFAYIASHDLQEPLRKIITFGDRLQSTVQNPKEQELDYIYRMQNSATRMKSFIDDLLNYTKVEMKAQRFEPVDLKEIATETMHEFEHRIEETKGTVNINNLPVVEADPFQMRQLFQNLIGNGLKFHRKEVPPILNLDGVCIKNGVWEITVEDNGIGIDEKHADRIFKPFERLHNRSTFEGTGIGLTICNKIVTRHGGEISVKRHAENGVTFHITLPEKQREKNI
ncbi:MAG: hypothetical protein NPINA01_25150 [Nitrospinaceae bacterium]|nr:MAG: hypothetical protein NPINA01_25150 [Nitrospinaceae bacterium]